MSIYAPNIGTPQYIRQMLITIKVKINSNTIITRDLNPPLTPIERSSRQKINTQTQALSHTLDQLNLINICRAFHTKTMDFTFFSSAPGTFSRIGHIMGHKSSLGNFFF